MTDSHLLHHPEMIMNPLYQNIRALRKSKGWKQKMMADMLSLSEHAYANIEQGKTDIQLSRLEQIAKVFNVEITELFKPDQNSLLKSSIDSSHGTHTHNYNHTASYVHQLINASCSNLEQELEKVRALLDEKSKEVDYLKGIIEWMKQKV